MIVLAAALDGVVFALGLTLLFDGGTWQQPTGFLLVAGAMAYLVFTVLVLGVVLAELLGEYARQAREDQP